MVRIKTCFLVCESIGYFKPCFLKITWETFFPVQQSGHDTPRLVRPGAHTKRYDWMNQEMGNRGSSNKKTGQVKLCFLGVNEVIFFLVITAGAFSFVSLWHGLYLVKKGKTRLKKEHLDSLVRYLIGLFSLLLKEISWYLIKHFNLKEREREIQGTSEAMESLSALLHLWTFFF